MLPAPMTNFAMLSVKIPGPMKRVIDTEAEREGTTTSAFVYDILADSLMSMA